VTVVPEVVAVLLLALIVSVELPLVLTGLGLKLALVFFGKPLTLSVTLLPVATLGTLIVMLLPFLLLRETVSELLAAVMVKSGSVCALTTTEWLNVPAVPEMVQLADVAGSGLEGEIVNVAVPFGATDEGLMDQLNPLLEQALASSVTLLLNPP
jgi:hypothetical protein